MNEHLHPSTKRATITLSRAFFCVCWLMCVCYRQPLRALFINTVANIWSGDQFLNAPASGTLLIQPITVTTPTWHFHPPWSLHPRALFYRIRTSRLIIRPTAADNNNEAIYRPHRPCVWDFQKQEEKKQKTNHKQKRCETACRTILV